MVGLLRLDAPALVTISGRGGVGKTALAQEVVRALGDDEPTTWVPLAGVTEHELVVSEIATALGAQVEPGDSPIEVVAGLLGSGSHLLVLDNAEHLLPAGPTIAELFGRNEGLRILVTSQAPLQLQDEHVVTLSPLPLPDDAASMSLEALAEEPAVATYCQRAAAVDRWFELTPRNAAAVVELCRRLEGLPLSLELAAARAATLPAAEIVRRVGQERGVGLLRRERRDVPERHHGLHEAIQWTYRLLSGGDQRALRRLSVVVGTFDVDTAICLVDPDGDDAAAAQALDALSTLVDFHLVDAVADSDPPRFSMPDSIRDFARARLVECGELDEVEQLRLRIRSRQSREVAAGTESGIEQRLLLRVEADRDDLHDALRQAAASGRADDALDLARGLGDFWDLYGYGPVQESMLDVAIESGERSGADPSKLANALLWSAYLGIRHCPAADHDELIGRIRRAEEIAHDVGDDAVLFHAQCVWLLVSPSTGDFDRAGTAAEVGLRLADDSDDESWRAVMLVWSGMLASLLGDTDRAVQLGTEALINARRSGDQETVVRAAVLLGANPDLVPPGSGVPPIEDVLSLSRELGLKYYERVLVIRLVERSIRSGDHDAAVGWLARALDDARLAVDSELAGFTLLAAAGTAQLCGDPLRAAFFYGTVRVGYDFLQSLVSETQRARQAAMLVAVEELLGEEEFAAQVLLGAALGRAEAVQQASRYVAQLRQPAIDAKQPPTSERQHPTDRLTGRQREVLTLLAAGMSNKDIAVELGLRPKTVMHHTSAIYRQLGVRGRGEAAALAFRLQLLD